MTKSEKELIARIKDDDPSAWDDYFNEYLPIVSMMIENHKMGRVVEDRLYLAYNVLKENFSYTKRYEIKKGIANVLYRITERKIFREYNKYMERQRDYEKESAGGNTIPEATERGPGPLDLAFESENASFLEICIKKLTKKLWDVIAFYKKGYSVADISRILGLTYGAAYQRKLAAFTSLRECISELQGI